jgi:hypothetical protein
MRVLSNVATKLLDVATEAGSGAVLSRWSASAKLGDRFPTARTNVLSRWCAEGRANPRPAGDWTPEMA